MNLSERPLSTPPTAEALAKLTLGFPERWILDRLQSAIDECTTALDAWRFNDYANGGYRFFRDDLCDWYLEWAKRAFKNGGETADVASQVISYCFDRVLRLLHPGMPFITEYLWQQLQSTIGDTPWSGKYLMTEPWPEPVSELRAINVESQMDYLQDVVRAIRNVRNLTELPDSEPLTVLMIWRTKLQDPAERERRDHLDANRDFIIDRANLNGFSTAVLNALDIKTNGSGVIATIREDRLIVVIPSHLLKGDTFKLQVTKRIAGIEKSIAGKQARLTNADYIARAPAQQVTDTRELLAKEEIELANLKETLAGL
jgi:valyl-tRNA synthetase